MEKAIQEADISSYDKNMLLNDEMFMTRHEELMEEGWVLQDISVDTCTADAGTSTNSTSITSQGKVVSSSYVQPTKTVKKYNNKLYAKAQDITKYVSLASDFIDTKWSWIDSKLFSIDSGQYAPWFNTGYLKKEENATLHLKDAYYKEGKKYWIGFCTKKYVSAVTLISYFKDSNKDPVQRSKTFKKTFTGARYNYSDTKLVALAKKYYKNDATTGFVTENPSISSIYRLN